MGQISQKFFERNPSQLLEDMYRVRGLLNYNGHIEVVNAVNEALFILQMIESQPFRKTKIGPVDALKQRLNLLCCDLHSNGFLSSAEHLMDALALISDPIRQPERFDLEEVTK